MSPAVGNMGTKNSTTKKQKGPDLSGPSHTNLDDELYRRFPKNSPIRFVPSSIFSFVTG